MNIDRTIAIAGVLVGIIGICMGYVAIKSAEDIAIKSGSLDKGLIDAYVGIFNLRQSKELEVIYGVDFETTKESIVIGSLPFFVKNNGRKSVSNLTVTYRYHEIFSRSAFEHLDYSFQGGYSSKEMDRYFSTMGLHDFASYRIPELNPGNTVMIGDPIGLVKTQVTTDVSLQDGSILPIRFDFQTRFDISVAAKDLMGSDYTITMRVVDSKSKQQLEDIVLNKLVDEELKKIRENNSFFQYLNMILFTDEKKDVVLIYPELNGVSAAGITIYNGKVKPSLVTSISYEKASWGYL